MDWKAQITIPNILTVLRLAAIPWMAVEIYQTKASSALSAVLFLVIWFTDVLDGWIARRWNQVSDLGKVLDPLVDKIFQITTAVMMTVVGRVPIFLPITMLLKESTMVVGALILMKYKFVPSAKWYGKLTTVLLAVAFTFVFFLPIRKIYLSKYIFITPVIMMFVSLIFYTIEAIKLYKKVKQNSGSFEQDE